MKRLISLILILTVFIGCIPLSVHAQRDLSCETVLAQELKELGLFRGVSDTDFDLESAPTREQAVTMLIRLLGKEHEALNGTWKHPFTDVSSWADPYIGYAYENGLTLGISDTKFGTGNASAAMYLTFVLRALGYSDTTASDFTWNNPYALAETVGILLDSVDLQNFLRADVVVVSHAALQAFLKGTAQTLAGKLISAGVFTQYLFARTYNREQAVMASLDVFSSQIDALGLPTEQALNRTISGAEMMALLDRMVAYAAPEKLDAWKTMYPVLRESDRTLLRIDVLSSVFLAGQLIGGSYADMPTTIDHENAEFRSLKELEECATWELFGDVPNFQITGWGENHFGTASHIYNTSRTCIVDGSRIMSFDTNDDSFHLQENATFADAMLAILRAVSIAETDYIIPYHSESAMTHSSIITDALVAKAQANPVVSADDHPRWTGFVLGYGYIGEIGTSTDDIALLTEWGFNSARVMINYKTLFSHDAETTDLSMLIELDKLVAAAIECNIHLNICFNAIPGRISYLNEDYVPSGEFDLFINPEKQEQALHIYQTIAARYRDIPNYNLSIMPIWEPLNKNLSTGQPAPEYGPEDTAAFLGRAIDAIRSEDPDRLIVYEATAGNVYDVIVEESTPAKTVADERGNVIISYNACEGTYVYACMTMTEGKHIDDMNNSMYVPSYPNYLYWLASHLESGETITLNGLLPAGTDVELYLAASGGGTLEISADGKRVYQEQLPDQWYEVGEYLSSHYEFAESDKCIRFTLDSGADELIISSEGGMMNICGIRLTLPDEYAVERWYYVQAYDVHLGNETESGVVKKTTSTVLICPNSYEGEARIVTIHDDLTYSTESLKEEASEETINKWAAEMNQFDGNCIIRFERGTFSGTTWQSLKAYYEDLLESYEDYGFSWWSNDWWEITNNTRTIAEAEYIEYAGYEHFNMELLELLQKYQSKD